MARLASAAAERSLRRETARSSSATARGRQRVKLASCGRFASVAGGEVSCIARRMKTGRTTDESTALLQHRGYFCVALLNGFLGTLAPDESGHAALERPSAA